MFNKKQTCRFEDGFIGLIIDAVSKWVVYCIVLALSSSNVLHTLGHITELLPTFAQVMKTVFSKTNENRQTTNPQVSSAREVLPIFVEGDSHDPVCGVEGLLHSITVVDVNVYV